MNCQSIQNQISTYLDCELDAELKREVRKHLFDCPECNTAYQELLTLKNCLENVEVPEIQFDSLAILYARLETEKRIIVQRPVFIMWGPRFLIAAACFSLFFLSALALFPVENTSNPSLAGDSEPQRSSYGGVSFDRNFSFDRSVTVYQASVISP